MGSTHFDEFASGLREFMFAPPRTVGSSAEPDHVFNRLALELFEQQFTHCLPYRNFSVARGAVPGKIGNWADIPAVPAAAFKELDLSCLPPSDRTAVFHSSGTSERQPSRHFHNARSLRIYEDSLLPWFQAHFLPDLEPCAASARGRSSLRQGKWDLAVLTPPPRQAPHSSLVYMFDTVRRVFGSGGRAFFGRVTRDGGWAVEVEDVLAALRRAAQTQRPLALLGTAFGFVHLLDYMVERDLMIRLPPGSRVMETGGYKGRSRVLSRLELRSLISARLDVPDTHILSEYGMSELSSQAYDGVVGSVGIAPDCVNQGLAAEPAATPRFQFPPWARSQVISPETGREVLDGQPGLVRVIDLANVYSIMAVQTEDLAICRGDRLELIGRNTRAEPRGCSLMSHAII